MPPSILRMLWSILFHILSFVITKGWIFACENVKWYFTPSVACKMYDDHSRLSQPMDLRTRISALGLSSKNMLSKLCPSSRSLRDPTLLLLAGRFSAADHLILRILSSSFWPENYAEIWLIESSGTLLGLGMGLTWPSGNTSFRINIGAYVVRVSWYCKEFCLPILSLKVRPAAGTLCGPEGIL